MKIIIKTALTPTLNIDTKKSSPFGSSITKFLKPYISVEGLPIYTPNGDPQNGGITFLIIAGLIALLVARGLYV